MAHDESTCADVLPSNGGGEFAFPEALSMSLASAEAQRCLLCLDPPCSRGCPAGTDPGAFVRKLRMKNWKGAVRTIKENNILGGACGIVCPVGRLCEKECLATGIERPIRIGEIQRTLVEYGWRIGFHPLSRKPDNHVRVAVIGSGPAGLSCAATLAREGCDVTVFEATDRVGGILRHGVPPFRLDPAFVDREIEDIAALGVTFSTGVAFDAPGAITNLLDQGFDAVFVATGLATPLRLPLPGADLQGVTTSAEFLRQARSDLGRRTIGDVVAGKNAVVVGGGSVAMDVATTCRSLGARRVYCVALEALEELPADHKDLLDAVDHHVIIKPQSRIIEILGTDGKVCGVRGCETEWARPGDLTPANARDVSGTDFALRVERVVFAIGSGPDPRLRDLLPGAEFTHRGLLQVDPETLATSIPGVFAGGDVVRGAALVVEAVADGKKAALGILARAGRTPDEGGTR